MGSFIKRIEVLILTALICGALITNAAQAQNKDGGGQSTQQSMNCDSTCLIPTPMDQPHVNIARTTKNVGKFTWGPVCGASAGSVVPSAPTTFLCEDGSKPSTVSTITTDGETKYTWSCSNAEGTLASQCTAMKREAGICGSDNGKTLSSPPTNLCAGGEAMGYALMGNEYKWMCKGNYGSPASCSATKGPVCEYVDAGEQCGTPIIGWHRVEYQSIYWCGSDYNGYWCEPTYGAYQCSTQWVRVCH